MFSQCVRTVRNLHLSSILRDPLKLKMVQKESELQLLINEVIGGNNPATVTNRSIQLCSIYKSMEPSGKYSFLKFLSDHYSIEMEQATSAAKAFLLAQEKGDVFLLRAQEKLQTTLIPPYDKVFNQIGKLAGGVKFLVDLRTDLLNLLSVADRKEANLFQLRSLNNHIKDLLSLWFSVGFLELQRITWQSSADIMQKISEYEAVHPIRNWPDLKRRVGPYRRCYVFTHHSMPGEPLVVLHTALTNDISSSVDTIVRRQDILSSAANKKNVPEDPNQIQAAIFYSITSTQKGLTGIELGNQLIKRVVAEIQVEYPHLRQFSTLSPIPGFREWLVNELIKAERGEAPENYVLLWEEATEISKHLNLQDSNLSTLYNNLLGNLKNNSWAQDDILSELLRKPIMRLCARYLYKEKRRGYALNSVANFHLRNGSVLWRLNWLADTSPRGLTNACGMMVNYRYFLEALEENSRRYIEEQQITASERVISLLEPNVTKSSL